MSRRERDKVRWRKHFLFKEEDGIRDVVRSREHGDEYRRQLRG